MEMWCPLHGDRIPLQFKGSQMPLICTLEVIVVQFIDNS